MKNLVNLLSKIKIFFITLNLNVLNLTDFDDVPFGGCCCGSTAI